MARILHISDTHLRAVSQGTSDRGPDFAAALLWCVQYAIEHKFHAVVHSGDLLNTNKPTSEDIDNLLEIYILALKARLPFYAITGNHDMATPPWPEMLAARVNKTLEAFGVTIQTDAGIICIDNKRVTVPGTNIAIQGFPFMARAELQAAIAAAAPADIAVWHGITKEFVGFPVDGAVEIADFDVGKFRVAMIGDVHIFKYIRCPDSQMLIGYPGSTELCDQGEALEKFAAAFEITEGSATPVAEPVPIRIPTRHVRVLQVSTEADLAGIIDDLANDPLIRPPNRLPILFVRYDPQIPAVIQRLKNAAPAGSILRYEALNIAGFRLQDSIAVEKIDAGVELRELLPEFIPAGDVRNLAEILLSPETDAKEVIQRFTNTRLQGPTEVEEKTSTAVPAA